MTEDLRLRGRIKNKQPNYAFILGKDGQDYFFYWTALNEGVGNKTFSQLAIGDTVTFIPNTSDPVKKRAEDIISLD
jgi:hypothetical protein